MNAYQEVASGSVVEGMEGIPALREIPLTVADNIIGWLRVPVTDDRHFRTHFIVSIDRHGEIPTDVEVLQIRSYAEYIANRIYHGPEIDRVLFGEKLPQCPGHITTTFRKGCADRSDGRGGWTYRRRTWTISPEFAPDRHEKGFRPLTLVALMDRIETWGDRKPSPHWQAWKAEHPTTGRGGRVLPLFAPDAACGKE